MAKQSGGNTAQRVEALVRPTVEGMGLRLKWLYATLRRASRALSS